MASSSNSKTEADADDDVPEESVSSSQIERWFDFLIFFDFAQILLKFDYQ